MLNLNKYFKIFIALFILNSSVYASSDFIKNQQWLSSIFKNDLFNNESFDSKFASTVDLNGIEDVYASLYIQNTNVHFNHTSKLNLNEYGEIHINNAHILFEGDLISTSLYNNITIQNNSCLLIQNSSQVDLKSKISVDSTSELRISNTAVSIPHSNIDIKGKLIVQNAGKINIQQSNLNMTESGLFGIDSSGSVLCENSNITGSGTLVISEPEVNNSTLINPILVLKNKSNLTCKKAYIPNGYLVEIEDGCTNNTQQLYCYTKN